MKSQPWLLAAAVALVLVGAGCAWRQPPQAGQPAAPSPAETVSVDGVVDAILNDAEVESPDTEADDASGLKSAEEDYAEFNDADYEIK